MWANHHATCALLSAVQHCQYLNSLPNPFCSDGLDEVRGSDRPKMLKAATRETGVIIPNATAVSGQLPRNFGSGSPPSARAFSETLTAQ
jgi:hypothetical protein